MTSKEESESNYNNSEEVIDNDLLDAYQPIYTKWIMVCSQNDNLKKESSDGNYSVAA